MSEVFINTSGNGVCYVDNSYPNDGESITIYATPDAGETLDDLYAQDANGYFIALAVSEEQTIRYRAAWGDVTITAIFSGSVDPPEPAFHLWWLIAKAAKRWRM